MVSLTGILSYLKHCEEYPEAAYLSVFFEQPICMGCLKCLADGVSSCLT